MKFIDLLMISINNLRKRKLRTFISVFAISIGTMLLATMLTIGTGVQNYFVNEANQFVSAKFVQVVPMEVAGGSTNGNDMLNKSGATKSAENKERYFKKISKKEIAQFSKINGVSEIRAVVSSMINYVAIDNSHGKKTAIVGYDLDYGTFTENDISDIRNKEKDNSIKPISYGRNLEKGDIDGVLISEAYLKNMGYVNYENLIGKDVSLVASMVKANNEIQQYTVDTKLIGIINDKFASDISVIVPMKISNALQDFAHTEKDVFNKNGYSYITIIAESITSISSIEKTINDMNYSTQTLKSIVKSINSSFLIVKGVLSIVGVIVLFVSSLGIINTMIMAIYERMRSIGILKALGASKRCIKNMFICESALLGFSGGLLGVIFTIFNTKIIAMILKSYLSKNNVDGINLVQMSSSVLLLSIAFSVIIAVIAGLYPSIKASKLDPIESLKYE